MDAVNFICSGMCDSPEKKIILIASCPCRWITPCALTGCGSPCAPWVTTAGDLGPSIFGTT